MIKIYNCDGWNWAWFMEYELHEDNTATLLRFFRLHKGEEWPEKYKNAPHHPCYYGSQHIKEDDKSRTALEVNDPEKGWVKLRNPKYIFDYKD